MTVRNKWVARLGFYFDGPTNTTLCALFWRCVLGSVLWFMVIPIMLAGLIVQLKINWRVPAIITAGTLLCGGLLFFIVWFCDSDFPGRQRGLTPADRLARQVSASLPGQYMKAVKQRVCPLIRVDTRAR